MSSRIKLRPSKFRSKKAGSSDKERLATAMQLHQSGQVAGAVEIYREVLERNPDDVDALHFLGVAEHQLGQNESGLEHISRALELAPNHPDAHNNRGNILKRLGRREEAEADYRRALALRPKDPNTLNNLGAVLRSRGDYPGAEVALREVISLRPNHAPAWQNLGNTLGAMGRLNEALDAHQEALRLAPDTPASYKHVGEALYAVGRIDDAAEVYRRWVAVHPGDPRARHYLASCTGNEVPGRASEAFVRAEFDSFAASFDDVLASLEYRAPTLVHEEVGRIFGAPSGRLRVLDAGCGTGLCGPLLRPFASFLTGVDLSPAMLALARQRSVYDALVVEELTAYFRGHDGAADLIVSADTLIYFGDLSEVISAAAKALRSGGTLVFTTEKTDPTQAPNGYRLNPHGRYSHSADYLLRVLSEAGFTDLAISEVTLRKEEGEWVLGHLVSAHVPGQLDAPKG
jgi:predicted TPR repeat methyltransferase